MRMLQFLKGKIRSCYQCLPAGLRRYLHRNGDRLCFAIVLALAMLSYVLLFVLPSFVLKVHFIVFQWIVLALILLFGVVLSLFVRKHKLRAICLTMSVCSLALCLYNFSTIGERLGSIEISTADDFKILNRFDSGNYVLVNDIDFQDSSVKTVHNFKGKIDGCGYSMNNLTLDNKSFFTVNSGTVTGFSLNNLTLQSNGKSIGFIGSNHGTVSEITVDGMVCKAKKAGSIGLTADSDGTLENIHVYNAALETEDCKNVGVIAGTAFELKGCAAGGSIHVQANAESSIGGLIGSLNNAEGSIQMCSANVSVSGNLNKKSRVGGIVGKSVSNRIITECSSVGSTAIISAAGQESVFGGICGEAAAADISNCFYDGTLSLGGAGKIYAGGILGSCSDSDKLKLGYSYTAGTVSVLTGDAVYGGFVGKCPDIVSQTTSAELKYMINVTSVSVSDGVTLRYNTGIGEVKADVYDFMEECYYDQSRSGDTNQGMIAGESSDMMTKTFCVNSLGWSHNTWDFNRGNVTLVNAEHFATADKIDQEKESDAIYSCKTLEVFPSQLFDEYVTKRVVSENKVNVRGGPGTKYKKLTSYENGKELIAVAEQNGWTLVKLEEGYGWVINDYLE